MNMIAAKEKAQTIVPQGEAAAILSIVTRAASDPNVDIDKLERLMAMQERALARQAEQEFNAALNRAQSRMGRIATNKVNAQTKSAYADYGKLDSVLRPIYAEEGFSLSFGTSADAPPDHVRVQCFVSHTGGHTRTYQADMPADGKGAKGGDVMTKTHAAGAAMSYGMRYLLKMIFNVAIGEQDDDGNGATIPNITEKQEIELRDLAESVGADLPKFLAYMKVGSLSAIPANQYNKAKAALNAKAKPHAAS